MRVFNTEIYSDYGVRGNSETMAISGITRFFVCAAGVSFGIGQKLTRTSHKVAKSIQAINGMARAKRTPQGDRFDFVFQIRSFIYKAAKVSENRRFSS